MRLDLPSTRVSPRQAPLRAPPRRAWAGAAWRVHDAVRQIETKNPGIYGINGV